MLFWLGILPALVWQFVLALIYLVAVPTEDSSLVYVLAKIGLVLWPLAWWIALKRITPKSDAQRWLSLWWGIVSAISISVGLGIFWFATQQWLLTLQPALAAEVSAFGLDRTSYILFALGLSIIHAGFEEWYWRSFVFRGLQLKMRWPLAAGVSSVAFAAHHAILIAQFAPWWFALFGAAIVGGAGYLWCYLYKRSGSILGSWLSHLVADLVVMTIGYLVIFN